MATKIATTPLEELVENSDVIVEGTVVELLMRDPQGNEPKEGNARIGPGYDNSLELVVSVDELLRNRAGNVPDTLKVDVWPMRHLRLESARDLYLDQTVFLLLVGDRLEPVSEPDFIRLSFERDEIRKLLNQERPHVQKPTNSE